MKKTIARMLELALAVLAVLTVCEYSAVRSSAEAAVDLVTVPARDAVQLTIYNSEDITLVKDKRTLTFKKGENQIQFSWANTLIDPTSVEIRPVGKAGDVEVIDTTYPAGRHEALIWNIESAIDGPVAVEITYFTSGITWGADYVALADEKEEKIRLIGDVGVTNNSGEDYENAQTRLVVGTINLVENIADLARGPRTMDRRNARDKFKRAVNRWKDEEPELSEAPAEGLADAGAPEQQKGILKEGLSEYFIYTVEGTETVPHRWSKRLPSLDVTEIPIEVVYRFADRKYGAKVTKFYKFKNRKVEDKAEGEKNLGEEPLPDGTVRVFKKFDDGALSFVGQQHIKYMPIGEEVELNLGHDPDVLIERKVLKIEKTDIKTESWGNSSRVVGCDVHYHMHTKIRNTKDMAIQFEVERYFEGDWELETETKYDKLDQQNVRFVLKLAPGEEKEFNYTLITHHGKNSRR